MFKNIKSIYLKKNIYKSVFLGLTLSYGICVLFIGIEGISETLGYPYIGPLVPFVLIPFIAPIATFFTYYLDSRSSSMSYIKIITMMLASLVLIHVIK